MPHQAIAKYAQAYAQAICGDFFSKQPAVTGELLKTFTPIRQVNLFMVKNLLLEWKKESERLKSPYFNFDHEEVKESLNAFMNTLSRHIRMERTAFEPLLIQAVKDTLLLIFIPYDYYKQEMSKAQLLRVEFMQEVAKYLKVNDRIWKEIITRMQNEGKEDVTADEAHKLMDQVVSEINESPADVEGYLVDFSKTLPLDMESFYAKESPPKTNESPAPAVSHNQRGASVHERFLEVKTTVHESFSGQETGKPTLAEIHSRKKITSIKETLTINQRYMFANELFKGDSTSFFKAIDSLDNLSSMEEALEFIRSNFDWNMEGEETQELLEIISKRY
jgi:hypothetical protein